MTVDLILIGNELLNGKIQDANTRILAKNLFKLGLKLRKVHIIQDDQSSFSHAIKDALGESQLIFTSGGLGPTRDDLTKTMLAHYFKKKIVFHQNAYELAQKHYERSEKIYEKENMFYHELPLEFTPIFNPTGRAPGIFFADEGFKIYCLPGVPSEFAAMLEEIIIPKLIEEKLGETKILQEQVTFKTWHIPESQIFNQLCPNLWNDLSQFGEVSSLPHPLSVDIGIIISAQNEHELLTKKDSIIKLVKKSQLTQYIWHIGTQSIEEVIIKEAHTKNLKIGFAESCTGGLCASRITDFSGASHIFWGSIISYANSVKEKTLNVSQETLKNFGAVSLETAKEMAIGAKKRLDADIVITTTGIAGPNGGSLEKPVGTVAIGVASKNRNTSHLYYFKGDRLSLKYKFSQQALFELLKEIRNY